MVNLYCNEDRSRLFGELRRGDRERATKYNSWNSDKPHRYWTADEHDRFLDGFKKYGKCPNYTLLISAYVGTRTPRQVYSHMHKYLIKLRKRKPPLRAESGTIGSFSSEDMVTVLEDYVENPHPTFGYWELVENWLVPTPSAGWETQLSHHFAPDE